ncbi:lysozyme inhibitor LprI family protein [Serratia sp. NPDC078593]|uniref:lysozyme inhibitor LprI family protein n=1 Tax=unclassified Serratia (in: enterobacteria) TaxID=2647522 RepID=UPI0037D6E945
MKLALLGGALLLATTSAALAQEDCGAKNNQMEMNQCASEAYKHADAELNRVYKQVQARLKTDASTGKLLINAQRAWIGYRDAECKLSASGTEGGSIYSFLLSSCLTDATQRRIDDLKGYLKCEEGDLACPVPSAD